MPVPHNLNIEMRLSAFQLVMLILVTTATGTRYSLSVSGSSFMRKDQPEHGKADHFKSLVTSVRFQSSMKKPIELEKTDFPDELRRQLQSIYEGHLYDAMWVENNKTAKAKEVEPARANVPKRATVYGELKPETLKDLFTHLGVDGDGTNGKRRFYDLGCGTGKLVHTAWLLGLNATGVELLRPRWQVACDHMRRARQLIPTFSPIGEIPVPSPDSIKLLHGSFLGYDFSDADVVFADSVTWPDHMLQNLAKTAELMKPGSYFVSARGKSLPGDRFQIVDNFVGPASWSSSQTFTIQKVLPVMPNNKSKEKVSLQEVTQSDMSPIPLEMCHCDDNQALLQKSIATAVPGVSPSSPLKRWLMLKWLMLIPLVFLVSISVVKICLMRASMG